LSSVRKDLEADLENEECRVVDARPGDFSCDLRTAVVVVRSQRRMARVEKGETSNDGARETDVRVGGTRYLCMCDGPR
jgi:hypothetical protein